VSREVAPSLRISWKFSGLTEAGHVFLEEHNRLAAGETRQQIHETISDNPERFVTYENAPRPEGS
jgi:hypothetical protein